MGTDPECPWLELKQALDAVPGGTHTPIGTAMGGDFGALSMLVCRCLSGPGPGGAGWKSDLLALLLRRLGAQSSPVVDEQVEYLFTRWPPPVLDGFFTLITANRGADWNRWEVAFVANWLFRRHWQVLVGLARVRLFRLKWYPSDNDARDVVSHVCGLGFFAIYPLYDPKRGGSNFLAYLHKCLANYCLRWLNERQRLLLCGSDGESMDPSSSVLDRLIEKEEISGIIEQLQCHASPYLRRVFDMMMQGKTHNEIAEELGSTAEAIKVALSRAISALRRRIEEKKRRS
jgi:RNA polymerase sigma factor (sigma-70 family)